MNSKVISEYHTWQSCMLHILNKYTENDKPGLVILLWQESCVSYISIEDSKVNDIPVMCSLVSRNTALLPDSTLSVLDWDPKSVDFIQDSLGHGFVKSAFLYEYDIPGNIELIRRFYPDMQRIAFISDNTYGGVTMQSLIRKEMGKYPELDLILLDGRTNSIYTIVDKLKLLPEHTVVLLGTWRIDKNEGYFMRNATYAMMEANPKLPAFTPTSLALGHWSMGGVTPAYRQLGDDMAVEAIRIMKEGKDAAVNIEVLPNRKVIDYKKIVELGLDTDSLSEDVVLLNRPITFYEQYKYPIWIVLSIFITLSVGLLVSLYFYIRTKRLKNQLEISEVSLREAKNIAEETSRLKSAFLANMSHEIRTPLNAIVGFTDVMAVEDISKQEMQECNEIIKNNADLLLRLINDILDLSRLESGRVKLEYAECDVVKLCQQTLASVEFSRRTNNTFVFDCDYDKYILNIDEQRMQQVIINLLSNASKFTQDGIITLGFCVDKEKKCAVFSITDTGCGIPPEKQKTVFDRFEKLNEYAQGTGLGLAICQLITEKWGGNIWVDPNYSNGARFVFTHPLKIKNKK